MTTDLAKKKPELDFAITRQAPDEIISMIQANIGGQITAGDLTKIKVPSGGSTVWEVPSLTGETQGAKELTGIIIHWQDHRAYWEGKFEGGNAQPACFSDNGLNGIGKPGGDCIKCPFSQYGSASNGEGQACKQIRSIFILPQDSLLPMVVNCPPTSIQPMRRYFLDLTAKLLPYWSVVTGLSLEAKENDSKIKFARIKPRAAQVLNGDIGPIITRYREALLPALQKSRRNVTEDLKDVTEV